jgi:hypothetical protein
MLLPYTFIFTRYKKVILAAKEKHFESRKMPA